MLRERNKTLRVSHFGDKNRWSLPRPKPRGALLGTEKMPLLLLEETIAKGKRPAGGVLFFLEGGK